MSITMRSSRTTRFQGGARGRSGYPSALGFDGMPNRMSPYSQSHALAMDEIFHKHTVKLGRHGMTRTPDLRFRKPTLYPVELRDVIYK